MTKRIFAMILCILMLLNLLSGCSKKQEILPEIAEAYEIDSAMEKEVEKLFEAFDEAFEKLVKSNPPDSEDFNEYAYAVYTAAQEFSDAFSGKSDLLSNKIKGTDDIGEKNAYAEISSRYVEIPAATMDLSMDLLLARSGESCAEAAVNLVNTYSRFFYGVDRITDEDMDRVG